MNRRRARARMHASAVSLLALATGAAMFVIADDARSQPGVNGGKPGPTGAPTAAPIPTGPQLGPCVQLASNTAKLEASAVATSPTSITISLIGFPGDYEVKTGGWSATVKLVAPQLTKASLESIPFKKAIEGPAPSRLAPTPLRGAALEAPPVRGAPAPAPAPTPTPTAIPLDKGTARNTAPAVVVTPTPPTLATSPVGGSVTHTTAAPNYNHSYTITGTLADGRKTCATTAAKTPPLPEPPKQPPKAETPPAAKALTGWADLHTHPMGNLAFGGHVFWGGQDETAFQVIDTQCRPNAPATGMLNALGAENSCNNLFRKGIVALVQTAAGGGVGGDNTVGAPMFANWPTWADGTHQKMWYEWLDRARKYGNLRVMVGLSHNNELIGKATPSFGPTSDRESSDLQIMEMKNFVARHPDIMQVALNSAQLYSIANSGRIAVVLGVELDNLGNGEWNKPGLTQQQAVAAEIQRLFDQGVRYVFPIHLRDNQFGGTAIYSTIFSISNFLNAGVNVSTECAPCGDEIGYRVGEIPICNQGTCRFKPGHRNNIGLTSLGEFAVKEIMKRGMIVDIDHMSEKAANRALEIAEKVPGYPLVSGHTSLRRGDVLKRSAENARSVAQLTRISNLGGMMGIGTDEAESWQWGKDYLEITQTMTKPGSVAFGTDMNSLVKSPKPTGRDVGYKTISPPKPEGPLGADFPPPVGTVKNTAQTAVRTWNISSDGVAQYGMMADYIRDVGKATPGNGGFDGAGLVNDKLMKSADYFWHMWEKCEAQKGLVK